MNEYVKRGEKYLLGCVFDGLAHSFDVVSEEYVKPYPEVTGYLLKYFCDRNYIEEKIISAANKLVSLQNEETGGWPSFYDTHKLYTFDTAQILIGLCGLYEKTNDEHYLYAAIKGGDFLIKMQLDNGGFAPIYNCITKQKVIDDNIYDIWNGPFSGLMCKVTEAYQALFDVTGKKDYLTLKKKVVEFYISSKYIEYTHPLGYWLEGLYCAERYDVIDSILQEKVIPRIRKNGYIPYSEQLPYAYVSGVIQLGIILWKMGYKELAILIRDYGRKVQEEHYSGGLFQYANEYGELDSHVHTEINSWGTKYFCELELMIEEENV